MKKCLRVLMPIVAALGLAACQAESMDGRFAPSCSAFAGDTLTFADGTFEWDKFTDEVLVDGAGNRIDSFPQHPVKGTFSVNGQQLVFQSDGGIAPDFSHLVRSGDDVFLLTDEELAKWTDTGTIPRCALQFRPTT